MMLQLVRQYNVLQQWEKALDTLKRAESLDTDNLQVKLLRIESSIHLAAAEQESARQEQLAILTEELAGLRDEHPDNVDIRLLQVMIAFRRDQLNLAEQILKQAIEACPNSLRAELQLAELYLGAQRLTEAIKVCQNACEQYGELARPWLSLALCHQLNQDAPGN